MKRYLGILIVLFFVPVLTMGQVTSSSMTGTVTDEDGEPLAGATVQVVHEPSGTTYGAATNREGTFNIRNMRIGGPYRATISFVGYRTYEQEGIDLSLGSTYDLDVELEEGSTELDEVVVTAGGVFDRENTSLSSNISTEDIDDAPNLGGDLADYLRATPQAYVANNDDDGPAISIAGQNNRYNSIFVDGAVNNDVFGLSAQGTNGGQTGATPFSAESIEQFEVNLSPFDVSQGGFTGGAINAITKSGSNSFEGSAYYFNRNESLAGKTPRQLAQINDTDREKLADFTNRRFGLNIGGPIVEDKLFFFVNAEILRSESPQPFTGGYQGDTGINGLEEIRTVLQDELSYDAGTFRDKAATLDSDKLLAKLDWNISDNHKAMFKYNYTGSDNIDEFQSTSSLINFSNNAEVFPNRTHSATLDISSNIGENMDNKLIVGYTDVKDDRGTAGDPFPTVTIFDGDGQIRLGAEPFSTSNLLEQQILTITDNFNIYAGDHTITIGTHNEFYSMLNQFIPFNYGWYFYDSTDDFLQSVRAVNDSNTDPAVPAIFQRGVSLVGDQNTIGDAAENPADFNAYQLGLYVQDEWQMTDEFRLTAGLRVDVPEITTTPRFSDDVFETTIPDLQEFRNLSGARPGETPSPQLYVSPRVGFNWDLSGEYQTQLRGGFGTFMGRTPFVWPGGMFVNNGANTGFANGGFFNGVNETSDGEIIPFVPNPENGLTLEDFGRAPDEVIPSGRMEIFEDDFRYPTVFRTSLGLDQELPRGFVATLEGQYTNTLNNIDVRNVNLRPQNETLDGPDSRPIYYYPNQDGEYSLSETQIDDRYDNIHVVGNTSKGYTYNITAALQKDFDFGLSGNVGWTYGDAKALNDGTSSQLNSIWDGQEHVNGANNLELARSDFSLGHRITANLRYRTEYFDNLATTFSLYYEGVSGRPFSYTISQSSNMIGENGGNTALVYVPENASDLEWVGDAAANAEALERYINSSDYLSGQRGDYAERNGDRTPFEHIVDLKIEQELFGNVLNRNQGLKLTLDVFNFTSLLGDIFGTDLGNRYVLSGFSPIEFEEFRDPENGDFTPVYDLNYDPNVIETEEDMFKTNNHDFGTYSSRWQMQLGVRYSF